ncbi:MAG: ABC transporter substrate-binding protein, partial [Methanospirillum sp.]|nr:ABC transporter substrate-binding protein [Methanospirillum sp.]
MKTSKTIRFIVSALFILVLGTSLCSASVEFTDSSGNSITLPAVADRVVCLNSDCAETMVVLGVGDKVVGVADSTTKDKVLISHLPKAVSIGEWQTPSIERVLALKPDAVITYSSSKPKNADQFVQAGINLIYLDCYKIDTLEHDVRALGT